MNLEAIKSWEVYFTELRRRLFLCLITIVVTFAVLFYFSNDLFSLIALPMLNHLPSDGRLIATTVPAPFLVPLKLSFMGAIFLVMPILLYHLWAFIAPALYKKEKSIFWILLILGSVLFYLGVAFAYFVVMPLVFNFVQAVTPTHVSIMTDINHYLDFVVKFMFAFGVAFEVPILVLLVTLSGVVEVATMAYVRPYIIVVAFVLGMLLTPPDVISQILLAIPMWLLYEFGLILAKIGIRYAYN
jgi:sec-independent protein translocase protein TatC